MKKLLMILAVVSLMAVSIGAYAEGNSPMGSMGGQPPQMQGSPNSQAPNGQEPRGQMPNDLGPWGEKPDSAPEKPVGEKPSDAPDAPPDLNGEKPEMNGQGPNGQAPHGQAPGAPHGKDDFESLLKSNVIDQTTYENIRKYMQENTSPQPQDMPEKPANSETPANQPEETMEDELLEKLRDAGILTEEQYSAILAARSVSAAE